MTKTIKNATDFILKALHDDLDVVLEFAKDQTDNIYYEQDWLEFKTICLPEKIKHNETKGDYLWNCAKSAIGMANSNGGIILIGIVDGGEICGVSDIFKKNMGDYIRDIFYPPNGWKTSEGKKSVYRFSLKSQIIPKKFTIKNKNIIGILVKPVEDKDFPIEIEHHNEGTKKVYVRRQGEYGRVEVLDSYKDIKDFAILRNQQERWSELWQKYYNFKQIERHLNYDSHAKKSLATPENLKEIYKEYETVERLLDKNKYKAIEFMHEYMHKTIYYIIYNAINKSTNNQTIIDLKKFIDNYMELSDNDWHQITNNIIPLIYKKQVPAAIVSFKNETIRSTLHNLSKNVSPERQITRELNKCYWTIDEMISSACSFYAQENEIEINDCIKNNLPRQSYTEFIGRDKYLNKILNFISDNERRHFLTITGVGGVGKTTLALEAAYTFLNNEKEGHDNISNKNKLNAIVWTSAKNREISENKIHEIVPDVTNKEQIINEIINVIDPDKGKKLLSQKDKNKHAELLLSQYKTLLIVDNMETLQDDKLTLFLSKEFPAPSKVITTDRRRPRDGSSLELLKLEESEAIALIYEYLNRFSLSNINKYTSDQLKRLAKHTGGIPRAIEWSVSLMTHKKYGIDDVLKILTGPSSSTLYKYLFDTSYSSISKMSQYILYVLAIFPYHLQGFIISNICNIGNEETIDYIVELEDYTLIRNTNIDQTHHDSVLKKYYNTEYLVRNFINNMHELSNTKAENRVKINICESFIKEIYDKNDKNEWPSPEYISWISNNVDSLKWVINYLYNINHFEKILPIVLSIGQPLHILGLISEHYHFCNAAKKSIHKSNHNYYDLSSLYIKHLSWNNFIRLELNKALKYALLGLKYAKKSKNQKLIGLAIRTLGLIHKEKCNFNKSKNCLYKSLSILFPLGYTHELAITYGSLSSLYRELKLYDKAMTYIEHAIYITKNLENTEEILSIFYQKNAKLNIYTDNLDNAETLIRKAQNIDKKIMRERGFAYNKLLMALIKEKSGDIRASLAYVNEAYDIFSKLNSKVEVEDAYYRINNIAYEKGYK